MSTPIERLPDGRPGSACDCGRALIADDAAQGSVEVAGTVHYTDAPCEQRGA